MVSEEHHIPPFAPPPGSDEHNAPDVPSIDQSHDGILAIGPRIIRTASDMNISDISVPETALLDLILNEAACLAKRIVECKKRYMVALLW